MTKNEEKITAPNTIMYVVVSGEYSDYGIVSLWSSKEDAKAECERMKETGDGYDFRVEEYFLNVSGATGARREVRGHSAWIEPGSISGEATEADVSTKNDSFMGEDEDRVYFLPENRYNKARICAFSESKENAVRLVLDALAKRRSKNAESPS